MNQNILWVRMGQFMRLLLVAFIIFAAWWVLVYVTPLLLPFIISFIITLIINRPVNWLERKGKMRRWLAVSIVLLLFLAIFITLITFLVVEVVTEISHLIEILPVYIDQFTNYFQTLITKDLFIDMYDRISHFYNNLEEGYQQQIGDKVGGALNSLASGGTELIENILNGLKGFLLSLPGAATIFVISILGTFFISKDFYKIKEKAGDLIPIKAHSRIQRIYEDLKHAFIGFIKAQLTLISITGGIVIVGLLILNVQYAITIGLLTGLIDLLPYLGTGAVFVPWIIYLFFVKDYSMVIGLSILYAVVIIQRQIMEPKILASNVGLDPLVTLIALFVGLKLFGFLGLIIGPVAIVVFMSLYRARVFQDTWKYIKTGEFNS